LRCETGAAQLGPGKDSDRGSHQGYLHYNNIFISFRIINNFENIVKLCCGYLGKFFFL
jgi:hypothetical protein